MFFEEETKDTHGNMDDYDLDIEQGESVSWDKLLDDKDDLDEPADLETKNESDDEDIADKLLNMDDDSFDAFIVKQQQAVAENSGNSNSDNEVDFDEFLLDDIDDETEDALKNVVKNDLGSNNYEPEVVHEEEFEEDDVFDFIQDEEEEAVEQVTPTVTSVSQNIQQEIAQINDLDDEEESVAQFVQEGENEAQAQVAEAYAKEEDDSFAPEQFAESTPDVPIVANNNQGDVGFENQKAQGAARGNFSQKSNVNEPKKQNSSATIILLVALLLGAAGYYGYTNFGDKLNFAGTSDSSADMSQDFSSVPPPSGEENVDTTTVQAPPADTVDAANPPAAVGDIQAPPADVDAPQVAQTQQVKPQAPTDTQATKSVSKAIEQGRTKISKDKEADKTKTSIQIVTTGRLNPFVPVGNLNNIGFITSPKIDILPPAETLSEPDPTLDKLMKIKVSGILYDGVNSSAVINLGGVDYFVQKGDKIDSFTVVDITKTTVSIKEKNNIFSATIGQAFTSDEIIKGQTQIQKYNNTVIRQYTTASDININTTNQQN